MGSSGSNDGEWVIMTTYLGGHPEHRRRREVSLYFDASGIEIKRWKTWFSIPVEQITGVSIVNPSQAETEITWTRLALLGPLALGFREQKKQAIIVVAFDNHEALFKAENNTPEDLRSRLGPIIVGYYRAAPQTAG
jgi:hypothetical protein